MRGSISAGFVSLPPASRIRHPTHQFALDALKHYSERNLRTIGRPRDAAASIKLVHRQANMTIYSLSIFLGALLMAQADDAVNVEPGKQLPQSVSIRAENDDGTDGDVRVRYMLFTPQDYKSDGEPWPLLLFLHGYGECSDTDLDRVKIHGPAKMVDSRPDFPFVVVSPQHPNLERDFSKIVKAWQPEHLIQLLDHVSKNMNIDPARVYVTGLSMGGYGTWRLAAAYPDRFAAVVPICGGGDRDKMTAGLLKVPIWAFHGDNDPIVPVSESRHMIFPLRQAGSEVRFTVYPGVAHNSWVQTYNNPEVYDWLLAHRKKQK
jgi:predicted peptidase